MSRNPCADKRAEVGDFYWGSGVNLHTTRKQKDHLGAGMMSENRNRKCRCFYILQIISEDLVLACTTTTRNSRTWEGMPVSYHKYFLPVSRAPSVRERDSIAVYNDWNSAFRPGKSLLYLEGIEVIQTQKLSGYICSVPPREIDRIKNEARVYAPGIYWGKYLSPVNCPGDVNRRRGRVYWTRDREFVRLCLDEHGLIILPEANMAHIRHSSKLPDIDNKSYRDQYRPVPGLLKYASRSSDYNTSSEDDGLRFVRMPKNERGK
ncbi:hypothetical protein RUND412_006609 [Rhizina undulata]